MPTIPPLDRYVRLGCIMFNPDGTLASIPFGVPYYEAFTSTQYSNASKNNNPSENLLCQKIGMYQTPSGYLRPRERCCLFGTRAVRRNLSTFR